MKVDLDVLKEENLFKIKLYVDEFVSERDYKLALTLIATVSADFYLDPEFEVEDLMDIVDKVKEQNKKEFVFEISEDGIEVEI